MFERVFDNPRVQFISNKQTGLNRYEHYHQFRRWVELAPVTSLGQLSYLFFQHFHVFSESELSDSFINGFDPFQKRLQGEF